MKNTTKRLTAFALLVTLALAPLTTIAKPTEAAAASSHQTVDGYSYPTEAVKILDEFNTYRKSMGLPLLKLNPILTEAAQNHANYLEAGDVLVHTEEKGKPGFTGETPTARVKAVGGSNLGSELSGVTEIIGSNKAYGGYTAVEQLMNVPFHRLPILDSTMTAIGVGVTDRDVVVDLSGKYDYNKGSSSLSQKGTVYPFDGQTNVYPQMLSWETPSPLEGTKYKHYSEVGSIISLFLSKDSDFDSSDVKVVSSKGESVDLVVKKDTVYGTLSEGLVHWYILPSALKANTKYTVKTNVKEWSFTTGALRGSTSEGSEPTKPTPTPTTREPLKQGNIYISNTEQASLNDLRTRTKFFNTTSKSGYVNVLVNNKEITTNPAAHIVNGNTFIPLRGVFEALGAKVEWESAIQQVVIRYIDKTVILQIGSKKARVLTGTGTKTTSSEFDIPVAPFIKEGSTFIPLRFVAESIGGEVKWYQDDYTAAIIAGYNIK